MAEERNPFVKGDEIEKITSIKNLKTPMINLFGTYPVYQWYGIIETYFKGELGDEVVDVLAKDGFIEIKSNTQPRAYRLTPKGIDFAISMINLDYSEKMDKLTKMIMILGLGTFVLVVNQILILLFSLFL